MSEPSGGSPVPGGVKPVGTSGTNVTPSAGTQPGAQGTTSSAASSPAVQFRSSEIGTVTARHEDPFKEHKARAAEKKQKNDRARKQVLIAIGAILLLILAGLGIWWLIGTMNKAEEEQTNAVIDEKINEIESEANDLYHYEDTEDKDGQDLEAVTDYYDDQKQNASSENELYRIIIAEMGFYAANEHPELVLETGKDLNPEDMPIVDGINFCSAIINAGNSIGEQDSDKVEQCEEFIKNNSTPDTGGVG